MEKNDLLIFPTSLAADPRMWKILDESTRQKATFDGETYYVCRLIANPSICYKSKQQMGRYELAGFDEDIEFSSNGNGVGAQSNVEGVYVEES